MQDSGGISAEWSRILSLTLLSTLLLMQPRMRLAFWAASAHLVAHVQLFVHQYLQVLLGRAALNPFIPQPVFVLGIALTQVQNRLFGLVELDEVCTGPHLQLVHGLFILCPCSSMGFLP